MKTLHLTIRRATAALAPLLPMALAAGSPQATFELLPPQLNQPVGMSVDGSVVVGSEFITASPLLMSGLVVDAVGSATRVTPLTGFESSNLTGVSHDGTTFCGFAFAANSPFSRAVRWDGSGTPVALMDPNVPFARARALGISGDGSVVVGEFFGPSGRSAARWDTSGQLLDLGSLPGDIVTSAVAASADGSVVVGWSVDSSLTNQAFR